MGRLAPPGYPNITSTPSRSRASRIMSAPVIFNFVLAPISKKSPRRWERGLVLRSEVLLQVTRGPALFRPSTRMSTTSRLRTMLRIHHTAPARIVTGVTYGQMAAARTLVQKIWDRHLVRSAAGEPDLLYV